MSEQEEYYANVYRDDDEAVVGLRWATRRDCQFEASSDAAFRIHVRLKPEGAPKRYACAAHRMAWERDPDRCRFLDAQDHMLFIEPGRGVYVVAKSSHPRPAA